MDRYPDVVQLLTIAGPNLESVLEPKDAVGMRAHRERRDGGAGRRSIPTGSAGACACAADERHRRGARGNRPRDHGICASAASRSSPIINGRPVDAPEILPLYEKMAAYNLPILLHPRRTNTTADYERRGRRRSISIYTNFGWPYETLAGDGAAGVRRAARAVPDAEDRRPTTPAG